ncbi:MAG: hypothetical protein U9R44_03165 [Candidatus Omnitrophota bacterium]|nr:hypothetical protein [Candidatus Omnitrophota bacterium]
MSIISEALKKAQEQRSDRKKVTYNGKSKTQIHGPAERVSETGTGIITSKKHLFVIIFLLPALAIAGFATTAYFLFFRSENALQKAPSQTVKAPVVPSKEKENTVFPLEDKIPEKDPLPPPSPPKEETLLSDETASLPFLNGIMYSPSRPQAIINGMMVDENERIGNFTVIKILPDRITLKSANKEFELKLR